jgi:hypothetical protein
MVSDLNSSISDYKSSKFAKPLETKAPVVSAEKASI